MAHGASTRNKRLHGAWLLFSNIVKSLRDFFLSDFDFCNNKYKIEVIVLVFYSRGALHSPHGYG